jgi:hypothetical protein
MANNIDASYFQDFRNFLKTCTGVERVEPTPETDYVLMGNYAGSEFVLYIGLCPNYEVQLSSKEPIDDLAKTLGRALGKRGQCPEFIIEDGLRIYYWKTTDPNGINNSAPIEPKEDLSAYQPLS